VGATNCIWNRCAARQLGFAGDLRTAAEFGQPLLVKALRVTMILSYWFWGS
jgi:hypothetical protein